MRIAIIDYGAGNLRSATKAFEVAAQDRKDISVSLTSDAGTIASCDRLVLPGQGAFADCMRGLESVSGLRSVLEESVLHKKKPFFGICVGMQLLATRGLEHGEHQGLGWLAGDVRALSPYDQNLKIPHMGWNHVTAQQAEHPLLRGLPSDTAFYFVHSYAFYPSDPSVNLLTCDYGGVFTAAVAKGHIVGTQFHPEKSQNLGLQLIRNFLDWQPE